MQRLQSKKYAGRVELDRLEFELQHPLEIVVQLPSKAVLKHEEQRTLGLERIMHFHKKRRLDILLSITRTYKHRSFHQNPLQHVSLPNILDLHLLKRVDLVIPLHVNFVNFRIPPLSQKLQNLKIRPLD